MEKIKIKGSAKRLSPAAPMLVTAVTALLLLPLRILQLANNTDLVTGFFERRDVFVYLFFVLAVAAPLLTTALSFFCGNMPSEKQADGVRPLSGIASLAMGAAFGLTAYRLFTTLNAAAETAGLSVYAAAKLNGELRPFLEMIFASVAVAAFVLYAVACFCGRRGWLRFVGLLFLAAPLWGICRVITYFTRTISYLVVGELFVELYAAVFLMLFLFCFARLVTETGSKGAVWTVVASGLVSALFCLLASVPRLITSAADIGTVAGYAIDWVYVAGALFSVVGVLSTVLKGVREEPEEEEPASAAEEEGDGDIEVKPFTIE